MRTIKFRAWHSLNKVIVDFKPEKLCVDNYQQQHLCNLMRGDHGDVLMQFTGLHDGGGTEIYEGDILRADGDVFEGEVIFDVMSGVWSCYIYRNQKKVELMTLVRFMHQRARAVSSTPVVIGNKYETPELITSK